MNKLRGERMLANKHVLYSVYIIDIILLSCLVMNKKKVHMSMCKVTKGKVVSVLTN
jgi:hypothetical protein